MVGFAQNAMRAINYLLIDWKKKVAINYFKKITISNPIDKDS